MAVLLADRSGRSEPVCSQNGPDKPATPSQNEPVVFTTSQDRQNMLDQLGVSKLRPGRDSNPKSANPANYDQAKANPYPKLPEVLETEGPELRQAGRARVGGDLVDRGEQCLPDECRRQLTRVAHAEVDRLAAACAHLGSPVVEPRERVLREVGEHGREVEAHAQTVPRRRCKSCSTSAAVTCAS